MSMTLPLQERLAQIVAEMRMYYGEGPARGDRMGIGFADRIAEALADAAKVREGSDVAQAVPVAWIQHMPSGGQELRWAQQVYRSDEANLKRTPLYAAPLTVQETQWLPIETAEENRIVLVACANSTIWIASKHEGDWLEMGEAHVSMLLEPTHWMPLPQPPASSTKEEK